MLIDEFGSGTEPTAGGAIAEAVLDSLAGRGAYGVITTHYTNLKLYASNSTNVANGAMQFDAEAIKPLFTLEQGLPGNSFAFELARKIGLPDDIIKSAEEKAGGDFVDMERQLRKIARNRRALDEKLSRVKNADRTLENLTDRYEKELSEIKTLRNSILSEAKAEAREIVAGANRQIEQTIREIREAQAEKEKTKQARAKVTELQQTLSEEKPRTEADDLIEKKMQQILERRQRQQERKAERARRAGEELPKPVVKAAEKPDPLKVGDKVRIKDSDMVGEIIQISTKKVSVAVGGLTTKTDIGKVDVSLTAWPEPRLYDTTKDNFELDGDPSVIASDILYFKTATDGYVRFEIPIHYKDDRTPSFIILTASASAYGAYFTGSTDSVLYIDDLRLNY